MPRMMNGRSAASGITGDHRAPRNLAPEPRDQSVAVPAARSRVERMTALGLPTLPLGPPGRWSMAMTVVRPAAYEGGRRLGLSDVSFLVEVRDPHVARAARAGQFGMGIS